MGIDGLNQFLKKKYKEAYKTVHISHFYGKKIVFDISSYIYKYMAIHGKDNNAWLKSFINLFCLFKKYSIYATMLLDGQSNSEKKEEREHRILEHDKGDERIFNIALDLNRYKQTGEASQLLLDLMKRLTFEQKSKRLLPSKKNKDEIPVEEKETPDDEKKSEGTISEANTEKTGMKDEIDIKLIEDYIEKKERNNFSIMPEDIILLKTLFDKFNIPYLQAQNEAETLGCYLVNSKKAHAIFSIDSDCIAYKCPIIINNLDVETECFTVIYFDKLCKMLELQPDEITLLCIISGTDYNRYTKKLKGIGIVTAYNLIKKFKNLETIKKNDKRFDVEDDGLRSEKCIKIFNTEYPDVKYVDVWNHRIDVDDIKKFLESIKINYDYNNIKKLWEPIKIVFED